MRFPALVVSVLIILGAATLASPPPSTAPAETPRPANIVLIVSDDAGYADFSMHGSPHFLTPRIDRLASEGVRFAEGYVSASVCSPSRAGLITGRYQQRFGHHKNIPPKYSEANGLPVEERTMADRLREGGYRTIALGKWHLGYAPHFHPLSRGFDDYFGFLQGARSYRPLKKPTRLNRLLRDREPVDESFTYMTDTLGEEAARYIDTHAARPFFMYLCFNAVHTPLHARPDVLKRIDASLPERRRKLAAMTISLDDAVGSVVDALERNGLTEDTLVVFVNDNGGQTQSGMDNTPLRGRKGQPYEGGIRVPFVARWPARWPRGLVYEHPVSTLDLLPTALAIAGVKADGLDGVDLTPHLLEPTGPPPHDVLYWTRSDNFAIRAGDLKLLRHGDRPVELFDIRADPTESNDLAKTRPDDVERLQAMFDAWNERNVSPRW